MFERTRRFIERRWFNLPPPPTPPWAGYADLGVVVDRTSAMSLSTVWACVRLLAGTVSRMPVDVLIDREGVPQPYPAPRWLTQPIRSNPNFNRVNHFGQVMTSLLLDGNAFVLTTRDNSNDVSELIVLDPRDVKVLGPGRYERYVRSGADVSIITATEELDANDLVHLPLLPFPGSDRGISPLEAARQVFGVGLASQEYAGRFFSQSQTPPGYIAVPAGSKASIDELKSGWENAHAGLARAHRPGVLTGGAEWKAIAITNEQAQFLEQRKFSVAEVARWYGVPPWMIGEVEKTTSWGAGIEQQGIGFVTYTLNDYLVLIEEGYRRLVPNPASYLRFNRNSLLRGDAETRAKFYDTLWKIGVMNADEIRAKEDMPPEPDGKGQGYYFWSANYSPVQPATGASDAMDSGAEPGMSDQSAMGGPEPANGQAHSLPSDEGGWLAASGRPVRERNR